MVLSVIFAVAAFFSIGLSTATSGFILLGVSCFILSLIIIIATQYRQLAKNARPSLYLKYLALACSYITSFAYALS